MKFIDDTLGIKTHIESWDKAETLPYYLTDLYEFIKASLDGYSCLFIKPKGELAALSALKKHIHKIQEAESVPIVLNLDNIVARRRKSLIEARIPFVVTGSQIYLPFMGAVLTERYLAEKSLNDTLMPSSQLLLFYYLYQNSPSLYTNGLAEKLGISVMQVTRAVRQLKDLRLMNVGKNGVQIVINCKTSFSDLFEAAKPYLLNPVYKKTYIEYKTLPKNLTVSGLSALAQLTMLNPPVLKTFAVFSKVELPKGSDVMVDSDTQVEIELWRYSPQLLTKKPGIVDTLSLIASMIDETDERIEQAIEGLLTNLWR